MISEISHQLLFMECLTAVPHSAEREIKRRADAPIESAPKEKSCKKKLLQLFTAIYARRGGVFRATGRQNMSD